MTRCVLKEIPWKKHLKFNVNTGLISTILHLSGRRTMYVSVTRQSQRQQQSKTLFVTGNLKKNWNCLRILSNLHFLWCRLNLHLSRIREIILIAALSPHVMRISLCLLRLILLRAILLKAAIVISLEIKGLLLLWNLWLESKIDLTTTWAEFNFA